MNELFVATEIDPRFAALTRMERVAIDDFVRLPGNWEIFARTVAVGLADVSQDLSATRAVTERIFSSLNAMIQDALASCVEDFATWSVASFQPRILARAVGTVPQLDAFIFRGFGSPPPRSSRPADWNCIHALQRFLYEQFQHEAKVCQESETPPGVRRAQEMMSSTKKGSRERPTHALIMKRKGDWQQALATVSEGHLDDFKECIVEERWDDLIEFGQIIHAMNRQRFIDSIRNKKIVETFDERNTYERHFDKIKFYKSLDFTYGNRVLSTDLEDIIYERIVGIGLASGGAGFGGDGDPLKGGALRDIPKFVQKKLSIIDDFAEANPGKPVSNLILEQFPELRNLTSDPEVGLPSASHTRRVMEREGSGSAQGASHTPTLWADRVSRSRNQDPIPFLRANYSEELEEGISIGQLKMRDELLGKAIERWAKKHPLPADLNLDMRTRQERNNDALLEVELARKEGRPLSFSDKEEKRIKQAEYRRSK